MRRAGAKSSVWIAMRELSAYVSSRPDAATPAFAAMECNVNSTRRALVAALFAALTGIAPAADAPIDVRDAWARPTVAGQPNGGAYLRIDNRGDRVDRLIGVRTDAAASAELHAMSMDGDVMRMRQ